MKPLPLLAALFALLVGIVWIATRTPTGPGTRIQVDRSEPLEAARDRENTAQLEDATSNRREPSGGAAPIEIASSTETDDKSTGLIRGRLLDQDSNPVAGTVLLKLAERVLFKNTVDDSGAFKFRNLPRGEYRLVVDTQSLAKGLLPPWRQDVPVSGTPPAGMFARTIKVPLTGGTFDVDLTVFRSGTVRGHAYGPDAEPVQNATIWLRSMDGSTENIQLSTPTDKLGAFEIGVYPGRYRVTISIGQTHRLAKVAKPIPQEISLLPGAVQEVVIRLENGSCAIEGTVLDQAGSPVNGVDVLAYYARDPADLASGVPPFNWNDSVATAITDVKGHFALTSLPVERLRVVVGARASSSSGFNGTKILKRWSEPRDFQFTSSNESQSAHWSVERSSVFTVRIRVNVDPAWASASGFDAERVRVKARSEVSGKETEISRDPLGDFVWSCETPCSITRFILYDRKQSFTPKEEVVHPEPSGSLELKLAVP